MLAAVVLGGAYMVVVKPKLDAAKERADIQAECNAIKAEIAEAELAGQDTNLLAILQARYRVCLERAGEAGVDVDTGSAYIHEMEGSAAKMRSAFADYQRTSYSDPVARDNKRGAIFYAAELFKNSTIALMNLDPPMTQENKTRALAIVDAALRDSRARIDCYCVGGNCSRAGVGCGRFGLNESDQRTRAEAERDTVLRPLGELRGQLAVARVRPKEVAT
jgi:hypothetical protein